MHKYCFEHSERANATTLNDRWLSLVYMNGQWAHSTHAHICTDILVCQNIAFKTITTVNITMTMALANSIYSFELHSLTTFRTNAHTRCFFFFLNYVFLWLKGEGIRLLVQWNQKPVIYLRRIDINIHNLSFINENNVKPIDIFDISNNNNWRQCYSCV